MRNERILQKLAAYVDKILGYCEGCDYEAFMADTKLVEACVFNRVEDDLAAAHPEIPWREMYGLRNRIVHDYEGVNLRLVWEIISEDLPVLKKTLQQR